MRATATRERIRSTIRVSARVFEILNPLKYTRYGVNLASSASNAGVSLLTFSVSLVITGVVSVPRG